MKKLFSFAVVLLLATLSAQAQNDQPAQNTDVSQASVHDRSGSQFAAAAMRIRASITPIPVTERGTLNAGGAVIRHVVVRQDDGRELRRHAHVNAVRFVIERPGLPIGILSVDVYTDFGMATVKMMIQ